MTKAPSLLLGLFLLLKAAPVLAEQVLVAVAANFSHSMVQLVDEFESTHPHQVNLTFGSSGKFYAQIMQGAPYALFLSADQAKPKALQQQQKIVPQSRITYAIGRLVLLAANPTNIATEQRLKQHRFSKLALANPKLAPYGLAAKQVLAEFNIKQNQQNNWVLAENVSQVYQFVVTGSADMGFVALSQVLQQQVDPSQYWLVPESLHQPIQQDMVWLKKAKDNPAAQALFNFMQTAKAKAIIRQHGYSIPQQGAL